MIKRWIRRFAIWLLGWTDTELLAIPPEVQTVLGLARKLCAEWESRDADGHYKRDRVFEQLLNTYPGIRSRHIELAILVARIYDGK